MNGVRSNTQNSQVQPEKGWSQRRSRLELLGEGDRKAVVGVLREETSGEAMNSKDTSSRSLCERSMKLVTNIIRLSSFSIAKASLGATGRPEPTKSLSSREKSFMVETEVAVPWFPGSLRSQEPQASSKPVSYLVEPNDEIGSAYVIHDKKNVDGMASDYINKVHKKNRHYLRETSEDSPIILPPPPRSVR